MSEKEKVYWDAEDPLKPVEGETTKSNIALHDYARMGYSRSLRKLGKRYNEQDEAPASSWELLGQWSMKFDWQDRVSRWDEMQRVHDELVWRERRDDVRQKEWKNFSRLQDIIAQMLEDIPTFIKRREKTLKGTPEVIDSHGSRVSKGEPSQKIIILSMDVNAAIKFIRTASDIGRRAAEMDQGYMAKLINEIDFSKLTPEQIARVAEGEHILDVLSIRK